MISVLTIIPEFLVLIDTYFFVNLLMTNTTTTTIAMTINIPKPIPALKIPSIASQEVNKKGTSNSVITVRGFIFFILFLFFE